MDNSQKVAINTRFFIKLWCFRFTFRCFCGIINISRKGVKRMVIDLESKRPVKTQMTPMRGIARPTLVRVIDSEFIDDVPKKRSEAAEPIKDVDDINKVSKHLVDSKRYRDNLLFICGINFGLRISDLLELKVGHLLNPDGRSYRDRITVQEMKTKNIRTLFPNDAVMDAADLYFNDLSEKKVPISLNDYLFQSYSNRGKNMEKNNLKRRSVERMLKEVINDECGIPIKASTHCLRKTFAYQVIINAKDRSRAIEFLQKIFGHSSQAVTLHYAGITDEEIQETYQNLNLGRLENWNVSTGLTLVKTKDPA